MERARDRVGGAMILVVLAMTSALASAGKGWSKGHHQQDYDNHIDVSGPKKSHLHHLEVVCSKDHMTVNMHFDQPFHGVVFSHGGARHERCVHVGPRAGAKDFSFHIRYDSCGTAEDMSGRFHENTIVVQFGEDVLEAWDEAKRLRCEWLESFEKPSEKPTLSISDIDVVELNFQGDDIDCWMEIQEGKGPWARQVGGLVPIGSPLTLVIAINDHSREFDMRIKRCSASNGKGSEIELTDHNGCVLRPSLLTPFAKVKDLSSKATLVAYSHLYAFKFPDKMDVYVHCIVEVCRHGCPDSCSHQVKDYFHPRKTSDTLESKKHQKLVDLANSKSIHLISVSDHHHLSKPSMFDSYPLPGREKLREILVPAAQQQVQHIALKNASLESAGLENKKIIKNEHRATFKPPASLNPHLKTTETKTLLESSQSIVHNVFTNTKNGLHIDQEPKFTAHHNPETLNSERGPGATYHRIIGHDIHWVSDGQNNAEKHHEKHSLPTLKDISYEAPKPEPSAWSADEVKPLTKHEVFHPHHNSKPEVDFSIHHSKSHNVHGSPKDHIPWSSDGIKPQIPSLHLFKQELSQNPQPEPSAWSADDVKPLTKHQVFHPHQISKPETDFNAHYLKSHEHKVHVPWTPDEVKPKIPSFHLHKELAPNPQPEPAPWTFDEVNPMHSPEAFRLKLQTNPPAEPRPEPAAWSLDDVTPLSKEALRLISLNHKIKNNPHLVLPEYREFVHHYSTSTIPQPVYVSRYTMSPQNMTMANMKMMMMMPTLLPYTYQTAQWPQRPTTRFLRPQRHHYPYPIPQFSSQQQMMMSVISDRRMDGDESGEDVSMHRDGEETANSTRIFIGETAGGDVSNEDSGEKEVDPKLILSSTESMEERSVLIGQTFTSKTTPNSKTVADFPSDSTPEMEDAKSTTTLKLSSDGRLDKASTTPEDISPGMNGPSESSSEVRPPISDFVPPSLDVSGTDPETKDRTAHGPRALDRRKRSSEPVFGVRQKFQAIAPSDLAFEWNLTAESTAVFNGRREEIIYGICISPAGMSAGVGFILILTLLSIIVSVVLYEHSCQLSHKTSQLAFFTRNFNGQFEALYRITRPYLYSHNSNVR